MTVSSVETVTLSDGVTFELRHADLLPPLTPEQYADLKADIERHGIKVPIHVTEWKEVVDGQHRLKIAQELGLTSEEVPQQYHLAEQGASVEDSRKLERHFALSLNINRRHLDVDSRARLVATLKADGLSNRAIADQVGVDERTVRRDLAKCSGAANAAPEHPPKSSIEDRREQVQEARAQGKSVRTIAEEVGASIGTVSADLKALEEPEPEERVRLVDQLRQSLMEPEPETAPERPAPRMFDPTRPARTTKLPPETDGAKVAHRVKTGPDRWDVVEDFSGELLGLICRGGPSITVHQGYTAHVVLDGVEYQMLGGSYCEAYGTLNEATKDIEKAHADPQKYLEARERRLRSYEDWRTKCGERPKWKKLPPGPINDLNLEKEEWKEANKDVLTDSLWLLGARAKGKGRSGDYHGNFVPQIPDQQIRRYTHAGDVVLDYFLGGSTSLLESVRLGRHFIGVDLQQKCIDRGWELLSECDDLAVDVKLVQGDSRGALVEHQIVATLEEWGRGDQVDHVFLHPPYWKAIEFTEDDDRDLSRAPELEKFLDDFRAVCWRAVHLLKVGKYLTLVCGDCSNAGWEPLAFRCMQRLLGLGVLQLVAINIKDLHGNQGKGNKTNMWRFRHLKNGSSEFKHEYIFVFRKREVAE